MDSAGGDNVERQHWRREARKQQGDSRGNWKRTRVQLGDGAAEVAECLALLRRDGYEGWLSLEVGGGGDSLEEAVHGAKVVADAWELA